MSRRDSSGTLTADCFNLPLRDASVQAIQLELIRRSSFNAMNGSRIVESLLRHRELWEAVMLDRLGFCDFERPRALRPGAFYKLRDLPGNYWNVDTLYLLTADADTAHNLARMIEVEEWAGEVQVHTDHTELASALGSYGDEHSLVSVWWD